MDHRFSTIALALSTALVLCTAALPAQDARARAERQASRASDRVVALQREADALAAEQRSLLVDLRRLEIERDLKTEQLRQIEADARMVARELGSIGNRIDAIELQTAASQPVLAGRLVELYKLGSAGYVRMLFNVSDLKELGRAYRMVATVAAMDRRRIEAHREQVAELRAAGAALERRSAELAKLERAADAARLAAGRAALARTQLISEIDARRDLTAELAAELQRAQVRLQQTLGAIDSGAPRAAVEGPALPIRPFRGVLDWPVEGRMLTQFGRQGATASSLPAQRGVQFAANEGSPVRAIHDGTIAYAGPFTGYGNLVIVDHGTQIFSLYGQLGAAQVERGASVERGDTIGTVGRVFAGIPGMYFEMRVDGSPVNPVQWLRRRP